MEIFRTEQEEKRCENIAVAEEKKQIEYIVAEELKQDSMRREDNVGNDK